MSNDNVYRLSAARQSARERRAAQSLYGQIRLTVTFEKSGALSYRAMAKRYTDDWRELHVFAQGGDRLREYPADFATALEVFAAVAENLRWMPSERS